MDDNNYLQRYSQIIDKYRSQGDKLISDQRLADAVNAYLAAPARKGRAHWHALRKGKYRPIWDTMDYLSVHADGWVKEMAVELKRELEEEWESSR